MEFIQCSKIESIPLSNEKRCYFTAKKELNQKFDTIEIIVNENKVVNNKFLKIKIIKTIRETKGIEKVSLIEFFNNVDSLVRFYVPKLSVIKCNNEY